MHQLRQDITHAFCMGFLIPVLILTVFSGVKEKNQPVIAEVTADSEDCNIRSAESAVPSVMRLREPEGTIRELELDSYLVCVVLAEIPASFPEEALKAQAVAARTFTQKAMVTGGKHGDGSVCTDPLCCQAYCPKNIYLAKGGTAENGEKVTRAVYATSGEVLTYEDSLIEATYYACSGGRSESAAEVWGTDYPYLVAQDSPGEESAEGYLATQTMTAEEFQNALGRRLEGEPEQWFGTQTRTEGGGIADMEIGGQRYTGGELRRLLGLRSTALEIHVSGSDIVIQTRGYGHRVGMSQYGAEAMAAAGYTYEEILAYYYPGTNLEMIKIQ